MDYDAFDAILHHIFKQTQGDAWFRPNEESTSAGVCLRVATQPSPHFRVFPYEHLALAPFEAAVRQLNPAVAVKVRSAAVHAALATVGEDDSAIYVDVNTRIQVMEEMRLLGKADKEQCAAFIRDERVLVVWADNIDDIIPLANELEDKLIKLVWRARPPYTASSSASMITSGSVGSMGALPRVTSSIMERSPLGVNAGGVTPGSASATGSGSGIESDVVDEKGLIVVPSASSPTAEPLGYNKEDPANANDKQKTKPAKRSWFGWRSTGEKQVKDRELEEGEGGREERPIRLFAPVYGGLGAGLSIFFIGSGITVLLQEWVLDNSLTRFALLVTAPFLFCVSLFFSLQVITNISFVIGPVAQFHENSKYYSAQPPLPNKNVDAALPHVSIQMPVYKESLKETIAPSVYSLKKAMQTYARQGGTSSIFINDDGMQLLSEADRLARQEFYADHGIGWVARPKHSDEPDGFKRAGRFKKASNMNYALDVSLRVEGVLRRMEEEERERRRVRRLERIAQRVDAGEDPASINVNVDDEELWDDEIGEDDYGLGMAGSVEEEENKEEKALQVALEELYEETGSQWRPWASNAKAIRLGELILIVDSDTVVPEDCFRDAARELSECPEVAIIQHESDVVQVAHHYFENGIAHFTRRINRCISIACANGEVAPFVGHNAFLRWSALQDAAFVDVADGKKKIWSEANVSEDFDMALRLQLAGYIIRWASYSKGGFKEGVSLTCDDELNRWQKYAYGCNELLFNPLIKWFTKGPINKQLHVFIWSAAPVHYKISMLSYMFSYYGLAAAMTLSMINYLILGFALPIDGFFEHSFEIWLACTVVFPGAGNLGFTLLEYRLGTRSLMDALVENLTWVPFFFFFFGGLSVHLSQALLAHLFSYNITWGATKKEVEKSNFFLEVPKILRRFWLSLVISFALVATMILLSTGLVPEGWRILPAADWAVIFPLAIVVGCHVLYPIVLNPWLMIFSY